MNINLSTINGILSGNINLASATVKSLLTLEDNSPVKNYLSDFASGTINYISQPFITAVSASGGTYGSTKGAYLSANSCLFTNITSDYTSQTVYLYNFIDTGDPATSNIISWQNFYSPTIIGATTFKINDDKLFNLVDGSYSYKTLYRDFRLNLINNNIGNLQNLNIGCALLSSSYTPDVQHASFGTISSHIISQVTVPGTYVIDGGLKSTQNYIEFPAGTGVISSVVFYVSSTTPENIKLMGYYNTSSTLSPATLTATGNALYVKLYQNTIFDLA
jgi:hypothetical protein